MSDGRPFDPPSPFIAAWAADLSRLGREPRRALDVAMGRGRHALLLAEAGFRVFGVDERFEATRDAAHQAAARGLVVRAWCADLTMYPLPRSLFDVIVVTRYLQRDLFGAIRNAVAPRGTVLYETFTEAQRARGHGPTSPDHLLAPGELRSHFDGFEIVFYEEAQEPDAVARIVARKPAGSG